MSSKSCCPISYDRDLLLLWSEVTIPVSDTQSQTAGKYQCRDPCEKGYWAYMKLWAYPNAFPQKWHEREVRPSRGTIGSVVWTRDRDEHEGVCPLPSPGVGSWGSCFFMKDLET
jgi:hypothetical protein